MNMPRSGLWWLVTLALPAGAFAAGTESESKGAPSPQKVEIFTNRAFPLTGLERVGHLFPGERLKIFDLDAVAVLEHDLSAGLPAEETEAKRFIEKRLSAMGPDIVMRFARAYQGVIQAQRYGLTQYPAVVFDGGQSVVYGEMDVTTALGRYHAWKIQRKGAP